MNDALKEHRYAQLAPKAIDDFSHQQEQNGVRIGFEYYGQGQFAVNGTVVIEFGILNGTGESIQVLPTDFAFSYRGQPAESAQLEFDAAAPELVDRGLSFLDWLGVAGSPSTTFDVVFFMPVNLALLPITGRTGRALKDYLAWRRGKAALKKMSFEYGAVPAGQFKHGLIFFEVKMSRDQWKSWPENWDITIDVLHHQRGPLVAEKAKPAWRKPYLPSIPVIALTLAFQFAVFAGICSLVELVVSGRLNAVPLICGGAYLVAALLVIVALAVEYR